jgi:hypothetical protein
MPFTPSLSAPLALKTWTPAPRTGMTAEQASIKNETRVGRGAPRASGAPAGQPLHLIFLFGFQDVTWIAVPPQGPGPLAVPQTSTPVPGGIQGLAFHSE